MMINRQSRFSLDLPSLRAYERQVKSVLDLGPREFNVCFVSDEDISRMNSVYRGKAVPTDVLSFPWEGEGESGPEEAAGGRIPELPGRHCDFCGHGRP